MEVNLPNFIIIEIETYLGEKKSVFFKRIKEIIGDFKEGRSTRVSLQEYFVSKEKIDDEIEQMILLTMFLLFYWNKEYETIIENYEKFNFTLDHQNLTIESCYLLSLRETFHFNKFKEVFPTVMTTIEKIEESREKEFLSLSMKEFSSTTEKKPEFGYKALNEILRFLLSMDDLAMQFPFILDALLCDLVNFAYVLADESIKELWIESAVKRAKNNENKGMLSSLYDLLANLAMKEYDLKKATEYIDQSQEIADLMESERLNVITKMNSATKEKMNGKLDSALEIYKDILNTENLLLPIKIQVLEKIGDIYILNEDFEKASSYYETAHKLNKENGYIYSLLEITYGYLRMLYKKDDSSALDFGMQLAEEQFDFNAMSYYYFYKGCYYKKRVNLSDAVDFFERALEFFENQIILEGIVYSHGELAESYFEMYRITENNIYANKFLYYIDNLLNITLELEHPLYVEALIIKASYYQYRDLDTNVAENLKLALKYAEKYNIEDKIEELQIRLRDRPSLLQELKGSKRLFKRIRRFSFGTHKKIPIILYLLLVIDEGGLPLFSYNFSEKQDMDDLLVSGLISAIISFSSEVLGKGVETLRSINHEGRAVIIEQQENIMAVLVADNETFESRLQVRKCLKEAVTKVKDSLSIKKLNQEEFQPIVQQIFSDSPFTLE